MIHRRSILTGLGSGLAMWAMRRAAARESAAAAPTEAIAVLGTGHLGGTLGTRLAATGHSVVYGSRTPGEERVTALVRDSGPNASVASLAQATARARIVVFALPWEPVKELLPKLGDLSGKLIIDPMNARPQVAAGYPVRPDSSTSVAEQLQSLVPQAQVVKAFNTIWYKNLANPARVGGPISIPLAGADPDAKRRVSQLVAALGLDPVDVGPLVAARYIEDLLRLEIGYAMYTKGKLFELYMRPVPT
jgi:8-hydroxy-5-deazaflavin:NADPH oxidoreductase